MPKQVRSFRIGRVQAYPRGKVWYLCYRENGQRSRPRVGPDKEAARRLASQINAQLESGAASLLNFQPISIPELRRHWLDHHEHVLRSSIHTISRYRTATDHLLAFLRNARPIRLASLFSPTDAELFTQYLRTIDVAPNGHANSPKRHLFDKGVKYILCSCRSLFTYAAKRHHLSPYAENPFSVIEVERIPVENAKPIVLFTQEQEKQFLRACDDWQFPIFLTLMLTGLRPGELAHLLLPEDVDLQSGILRVRNKPQLGWQVKTRNEREVPLVPELVEVMKVMIGYRRHGPLFRQPRCERLGHEPPLAGMNRQQLEAEAARRLEEKQREASRAVSRIERLAILRTVWRDIAAIKEDRIRIEFIRIGGRIGVHHATAPKLLRHMFATSLQDANVDPLVRNLLMGHMPGNSRGAGTGLGMTAVYTHTRTQTVKGQLASALSRRPSRSLRTAAEVHTSRAEEELPGSAQTAAARPKNCSKPPNS